MILLPLYDKEAGVRWGLFMFWALSVCVCLIQTTQSAGGISPSTDAKPRGRAAENAAGLPDGSKLSKSDLEFFQEMDKDRDGYIRPDELGELLAGFGDKAFDEDSEIKLGVQTVLHNVDRNDDTVLSINDLRTYWLKLGSLLTTEKASLWVEHAVQLPDVATSFRKHRITGYDFPSLLTNPGELAELNVSKENKRRLLRAIKLKLIGVGTEPGIPIDFSYRSQTCTSISLSWKSPEETGGFPIHKYILQRQLESTGAVEWKTVMEGPDIDYLDTGLDPELSYRYRVQVWTLAGSSRFAVLENCQTADRCISKERASRYGTLWSFTRDVDAFGSFAFSMSPLVAIALFLGYMVIRSSKGKHALHTSHKYSKRLEKKRETLRLIDEVCTEKESSGSDADEKGTSPSSQDTGRGALSVPDTSPETPTSSKIAKRLTARGASADFLSESALSPSRESRKKGLPPTHPISSTSSASSLSSRSLSSSSTYIHHPSQQQVHVRNNIYIDPNSEYDRCAICHRQFKLHRIKHHCSVCTAVFCSRHGHTPHPAFTDCGIPGECLCRVCKDRQESILHPEKAKSELKKSASSATLSTTVVVPTPEDSQKAIVRGSSHGNISLLDGLKDSSELSDGTKKAVKSYTDADSNAGVTSPYLETMSGKGDDIVDASSVKDAQQEAIANDLETSVLSPKSSSGRPRMKKMKSMRYYLAKIKSGDSNGSSAGNDGSSPLLLSSATSTPCSGASSPHQPGYHDRSISDDEKSIEGLPAHSSDCALSPDPQITSAPSSPTTQSFRAFVEKEGIVDRPSLSSGTSDVQRPKKKKSVRHLLTKMKSFTLSKGSSDLGHVEEVATRSPEEEQILSISEASTDTKLRAASH